MALKDAHRVLAGILGARIARRQPEALDQYQQRLSAEIFTTNTFSLSSSVSGRS